MNPETEPVPTLTAQPCPDPAPPLALLPAPPNAIQAPSAPARKVRRNGVIARLPKAQRDMVSRMIYDGVPYIRILAALEELEIFVTARNISNWKTRGGYGEWRAEQNLAIETRLQQDKLLDLIRYEEPTKLSEVGVQALATALSHWLSRPDSIKQLLQEPAKLRSVTANICQLNRELRELQKYHNSYACWHRRDKQKAITDDIDGVRSTFSAPNPPENPNSLPPRPRKTIAEIWPAATPAPKPVPPA